MPGGRPAPALVRLVSRGGRSAALVAAWPVSDWFLHEGERAPWTAGNLVSPHVHGADYFAVTSRLWRPRGLATGSSSPTGAAIPTSARTSGAVLVPHPVQRRHSAPLRQRRLRYPQHQPRQSPQPAAVQQRRQIDLYIGPEAPTGAENNWMKTVDQDGWFVCFSLYAPTEPFFDRSWSLPDFQSDCSARPGDRQPTSRSLREAGA